MGPPPPSPAQGLCFCAPWPWRIDRMEGLEGGEGAGAGLRFFLQCDPAKAGLDRTLVGISLSALFSRLLGWTKHGQRSGAMLITGEEGTDSATAAVSAAVLAAAVSACLAAMHASSHRPRPPRRPRLSAPNSAPRSRALPAPGDGLRILSSKVESLENVIHGASIGAGDDEPAIVARVEATQADTAGANADDEAENGRSEQERREVERMRELWLSLVEREQRLELRLRELEGLREQAASIQELESRVAASAMEARLLELKVSSLQEENGRLRAQAVELDDARAELARAREKLRAIKARVQADQEESAALRARAAELEKAREERATKLAVVVAALRTANAELEEENMELALRLREAQQAASSVNHVLEKDMDMFEEAKHLREANERMAQQIEQLRNDHCAHVEELVYLKWVNACLRHELRDHGQHPSSEKPEQDEADSGGALSSSVSAMELSKSMSFRSSERARQLMLRYGHPGLDGSFDPALFSPLHESIDGDARRRDSDKRMRTRNYEPAERSPASTSAAAASSAAPGKKKDGPRKPKFLGNIKKMFTGRKKDHSGHGHGHGRKSTQAPAPTDEYLEKAMQWLSTHDVLDLDRSYESTPLSSCDRTPPSSVTTVTPRGGGERGVAHQAGGDDPAPLARSRSDAGASYGREASRYHALRPDHPAAEVAEAGPAGLHAPEKQGMRRRSEELAYLRTGDMHAH